MKSWYDEFVEQHGLKEEDRINYRGWHRWPSGALVEDNALHGSNGTWMAASRGPSANPLTLWTDKLAYREARLEQAKEQFNDLKRLLDFNLNQAQKNGGLGPTKEQVEHLRPLKAEVKRWEKEVEEAKHEVSVLDGSYKSPEELEERARQDDHAAQHRDKIAAMLSEIEI